MLKQRSVEAAALCVSRSEPAKHAMHLQQAITLANCIVAIAGPRKISPDGCCRAGSVRSPVLVRRDEFCVRESIPLRWPDVEFEIGAQLFGTTIFKDSDPLIALSDQIRYFITCVVVRGICAKESGRTSSHTVDQMASGQSRLYQL